MVVPIAPFIPAALQVSESMLKYFTQANQQNSQAIALQKLADLEILRVEAQAYEIHAQKEVYLALIEGAASLYKKRLKVFDKMMQKTQGLLESHQKILIEERKQIVKKQMLEDIPDREFSYLSLRQHEIEIALIDISTLSFELTQAAQCVMMMKDPLSERLGRA